MAVRASEPDNLALLEELEADSGFPDLREPRPQVLRQLAHLSGWQRKTLIAAGLLSVAALFGFVTTKGLLTIAKTSNDVGLVARAPSASHRLSPQALKEMAEHGEAPKFAQSTSACGSVVEDVNYVMEKGSWEDHIDHISSAGACCDLCRHKPECHAWTWVQNARLNTGNPAQCWMKGGKIAKKETKVGVISGLATGGEKTHESNSAAVAAASANKCAASGEDCSKSKCCQEANHQCFTKNEFWSECMETCLPGPNPLDQQSPMPWSCKPLGNRTAGKSKECSADGEDCLKTQCCKDAGMQCFQKDETFAMCKPACMPGPQLDSPDPDIWWCKPLGPRKVGAAAWVKTKCAHAGQDCRAQQCCADPGQQCYKQNDYHGACMGGCKPGWKANAFDKPWACNTIGSRTPLFSEHTANTPKVISDWVVKKCSSFGQDCTKSQCCYEVNAQCYKKNKYYATCKKTCSTAPDPYDNNRTWECSTLGPRSWGLATKGWPSLYCFTLYMPYRYEGALMAAQLKEGAGIFSCDGYDVLSADPHTLGKSKGGHVVKAILIPKITVGVSQDGTAGNAKLFMAVWDKIIASGRFRNYDWTIKVDPDAVMVPWRIREHMKPHVGANAYVVNCNKFPGSPNFPMMFGAVEIFSNVAMDAYAAGSARCGSQLPWGGWGEDYYMTHCLDFLGVGRISDFGTLGDNLCTGANCGDTYTASFHPFKSVGAWMGCWSTATSTGV